MKILTPLLAVLFSFCGALSASAQWKPTGPLLQIQVIEDCSKTGGDIAVATTIGSNRLIFFCQQNANLTNARWPGAGHFYYVHEYGHHALNSSDERAVDCWAAKQLKSAPNGDYYLQAAIRHFTDRGSVFHPRYGTALERAQRIETCSEEVQEDDESETPAESRDSNSPGRHAIFPSPSKPGKRVGGVITDERAEELFDYDSDFRWDTNPNNPYAYYTITLINKGTRTLECLSRAMIHIVSRETREIVRSKWNIDEQRFKLKPGETKVIKGKIQWFGNSSYMPRYDDEVIAMFAR